MFMVVDRNETAVRLFKKSKKQVSIFKRYVNELRQKYVLCHRMKCMKGFFVILMERGFAATG